MFRTMRRRAQQTDPSDCERILRDATSGVLALAGDDGYPYAVPMSFVYDGERATVYFHSARDGHKLDAIRNCAKASFCAIGRDRVASREFTTYYESVIAFGNARIVDDAREHAYAIGILADKYAPDVAPSERRREIEQAEGRYCMIALRIEHMTGKRARLAADSRD